MWPNIMNSLTYVCKKNPGTDELMVQVLSLGVVDTVHLWTASLGKIPYTWKFHIAQFSCFSFPQKINPPLH